MKAQLRRWRNDQTGESGELVWFWCAGCASHHAINPKGWTWNGDTERPTFSPSVLVRGSEFTAEGKAMHERGEAPPGGQYPSRDTVCHSFVREGRIEYLTDSTHALAGQTVPLEDLDLP
jgi:hypothetical protein